MFYLDSGLDLSVNDGANQNLSENISASETDNLSMSGSSSFQSSQNTSKSEKVKSGAVSLMSTPEDQVTYRKYRIRKTQGVLKQCTNQKISFRERYVELSKRFLTDPASMPLDEIEVLNLKCTQALQGEMSSPEKSDNSDSDEKPNTPMQPLLSRKKPKHYQSSHSQSMNTQLTQQTPSFHQNWMLGPSAAQIPSQISGSQHHQQYSNVPLNPNQYHAMPQQTTLAATSAGLAQNLKYQTSCPMPSFGQTFRKAYTQMPNLNIGNTFLTAPGATVTPPTTTSTPIPKPDLTVQIKKVRKRKSQLRHFFPNSLLYLKSKCISITCNVKFLGIS